MPRHADKRLRLRRADITHGDGGSAAVDIPRGPRDRSQPTDARAGSPAGAIVGPYANECRCGLPWCTWTPAALAEARRGATGQPRGSDAARRRRTGAWETPDKRFVLEWTGQIGRTSNAKPRGWLRLFDRVTSREAWFVSIKEAREYIAGVYDAPAGRGKRAAGSGGQHGKR